MEDIRNARFSFLIKFVVVDFVSFNSVKIDEDFSQLGVCSVDDLICLK